MDAACEQQAQALVEPRPPVLPALSESQEALDLRLPQREAGTGTDVSAALPALEDEPACAVGEEPVEQSGRRGVDEGPGPLGLQRCSLAGPAAGDEGVGGPGRAHHPELRFAQLGGDEPEDPHSPRPAGEHLRRLGEQAARVVAAHQRQGDERQAAGAGDLGGEGGAVADPGHRSLRHRESQGA